MFEFLYSYIPCKCGATNTLKIKMMKHLRAPSAVCENMKPRYRTFNSAFLVQVKPTYPTVMVSFSIINFSSEPNEIIWSVITFLSRDTVKQNMFSKDFSAQVKFLSQSAVSDRKMKANEK